MNDLVIDSHVLLHHTDGLWARGHRVHHRLPVDVATAHNLERLVVWMALELWLMMCRVLLRLTSQSTVCLVTLVCLVRVCLMVSAQVPTCTVTSQEVVNVVANPTGLVPIVTSLKSQ